MNKQQALQRLTAIEKETEELRAIINAPDKEQRWKPDDGDKYYFINGAGLVGRDIWQGWGTDSFHFNSGNTYYTREEAERAAEILKTIGEKRFRPDWQESEQSKYSIIYYHDIKKFIIDKTGGLQRSGAYFPDKQTAQSIIDQYGDDLFLVMDRI